MTYTVHEQFYTWQGEGDHMGKAAWFIRLQGCDQKCPWCDAAGTWHPDHKPDNLERYTPVELANCVEAPPGAIVVITGGEPCLYDLDPLIDALADRGYPAHIETAGHRPLPTRPCWVTLSPKPFATPPLAANVMRADEFKVIVSGPRSMADGLAFTRPGCSTWLHPEWSKHNDQEVLDLITETVKDNPDLRAGWQLHKAYRSDQLDPASRPAVPLGGVSGSPW